MGVYFNAPTDQDLGSHHHPSGKATQTLVKSDPAGWPSLPYCQYSPFLLPASMGPVTTSLSSFYPNFGADFIFLPAFTIHRQKRGFLSAHSGDGWWKPLLTRGSSCPTLRGFPLSQSTNASGRGHLLLFTPSYLQQMMNSLVMLSPGNRTAARQQTDRQRGPCVLLVDQPGGVR